jgi:predicted GNAT family acetyltransferase
LNVIRHPTAQSFLEHAQPWLMRAEIENNVILGIALAIVRETVIPKESPYFVTVVDKEEVVGCALRIPPHKLIVSRTTAGAAKAIARDAFALHPALVGVIGPEPAAGAFASVWSELAHKTVHVGTRQRMHVIDAVAPLQRSAAGVLRRAEETEIDLVIPWVAAFRQEAVPSEPSDPHDVVRRYLSYRGLFVWDDESPVSLAAFGGKTANGVRVSLVYTPPALRGRGYATAAVAALTRLLLDQGNRYCCLYTDLANPTSNRIYRKIGYRPLCDVNDYVLAGA